MMHLNYAVVVISFCESRTRIAYPMTGAGSTHAKLASLFALFRT